MALLIGAIRLWRCERSQERERFSSTATHYLIWGDPILILKAEAILKGEEWDGSSEIAHC